MKKSFKIILTVLSVMAIQSVGWAQPKMSPDEMAKHETEWMTRELKLTDEQQEKVQEVNLTFANRMKEQFELDRESGGRPDHSNMQKMDEEKNKALKEILTEDQYTAYLEKQKEHFPGPKPMPDNE